MAASSKEDINDILDIIVPDQGNIYNIKLIEEGFRAGFLFVVNKDIKSRHLVNVPPHTYLAVGRNGKNKLGLLYNKNLFNYIDSPEQLFGKDGFTTLDDEKLGQVLGYPCSHEAMFIDSDKKNGLSFIAELNSGRDVYLFGFVCNTKEINIAMMRHLMTKLAEAHGILSAFKEIRHVKLKITKQGELIRVIKTGDRL